MPCECGLGQSSCHYDVLLLGEPFGLPLLTGFRREMRTAWRSATEAARARNPLFMRLRRTLPMVTMRLWGGQSQWEKPDFHSFLAIFFGFCLFLAYFLGF
jgi:hypothetical protein